VPSGYLKTTQAGLTQPQADTLKAKWLEAHGGDEASIAVLNATTEFTPVSWSPVDAALAEVKRLNVADVAFSFGMAPETLGVTMGNSATYSNVAQWFEAHRDFALSPWEAALEGTLSALLPQGDLALVNLDAYTQPPLAERLEAYAGAIAAGIYTANEVRALEGLAPLPEPEPQPVPSALLAAQGDPDQEPTEVEEDPNAPA
jgi:HK97 family phage portal protein